MQRVHRLSAAVVVVAGLLAGCIGGAPSSEALRQGPNVARQPGVEDPIEVGVRVHEAGLPNAALFDAEVVFFTVADEELPEEGRASVDGCGGGTGVEAWGPFEVLATTRTDRSGVAYGLVEPTRATALEDPPVHVAVGGVDGRLTAVVAEHDDRVRWDCPVRSTWSDDAERSLLVGVLPRRQAFRVDGTTGPAPPTWHLYHDGPQWEASRLRLVDSGALAEHWTGRMARVEATLTWTNEPSRWADLYLGVGAYREAGPEETGTDRFQGPHTTGARERIDVELGGSDRVPLIGPATDEGVIGAGELPYAIVGNVTFRGPDLALGAS